MNLQNDILPSDDPYQIALQYLYSFIDYEKLPGAAPRRMSLEKIETLVGLLGHPERKYPVVHITGTKGKGSTAAMISSILNQSGYRVGLYTSPHLVTLRERVRINGEPLPKADLCRMAEAIREPIGAMTRSSAGGPETFFDVWTALAFSYFAEQKVDIAVIEVGMGGRVDSTNVVWPRVAVITPIGLDHTDRLGHTLPEIACEKAGIIKRGVPTVISPQQPEALTVIEETCIRNKSLLTKVGSDIRYTIKESNTERQIIDVESRDSSYNGLELPLLGGYQAINAATALGTVDCLRKQEIPITDAGVVRGLRSVTWPGRLQVIGQRPWVILDGAHNPMAARNLTQNVRALFRYHKAILILSLQQDKAVEELCQEFAAWADIIIVTGRRVMRRRQADSGQVVSLCTGPGRAVFTTPMVSDALAMAKALATEDDLICVSGSLALVGEVMEVLQNLEPEETLSRL